jgi:hypothetical protein
MLSPTSTPLIRSRPVMATKCRTARAAWAGGGYLAVGQVERWVDLCRNELARGRGDRPFTWACLSLH